jgi:hypothetical protein
MSSEMFSHSYSAVRVSLVEGSLLCHSVCQEHLLEIDWEWYSALLKENIDFVKIVI